IVMIEDHPDDAAPAAKAKKLAEEIPGNRLESTPIQIAGADAHRVVLRQALGGIDTKMMVIYVIRDARQYILIYSADAAQYDQHLPGLTAVLDSIRWTGATPSVADTTQRREPGAAARMPAGAKPGPSDP